MREAIVGVLDLLDEAQCKGAHAAGDIGYADPGVAPGSVAAKVEPLQDSAPVAKAEPVSNDTALQLLEPSTSQITLRDFGTYDMSGFFSEEEPSECAKSPAQVLDCSAALDERLLAIAYATPTMGIPTKKKKLRTKSPTKTPAKTSKGPKRTTPMKIAKERASPNKTSKAPKRASPSKTSKAPTRTSPSKTSKPPVRMSAEHARIGKQVLNEVMQMHKDGKLPTRGLSMERRYVQSRLYYKVRTLCVGKGLPDSVAKRFAVDAHALA